MMLRFCALLTGVGALQISRRAAIAAGGTALVAPIFAPARGSAAGIAKASKVVVVGGDGFIGSRAVQELLALQPGLTVVSLSRRSAGPPAWAVSETWAGAAEWAQADVLTDNLAAYLKGADAVVSCVGALGSADDETANGLANVKVAEAAKAAGAKRFVYVSAHPLVKTAAADAGLLEEYFKGKAEAEAAVTAAFGAEATILRPTLVYGGDAFAVSPPRVPGFWGGFVETVLSSAPLRAAADLFSAVPALKVALLPPVDVDTVARAIALAALGAGPGGDVVGTDAIKSLAHAAP